MNILELKNITKTYNTGAGKLPVLQGVNFALKTGESVAIIGESGAGKSTFLHVAGLLDEVESGEIVISGTVTKGLRDSKLAKIRNQTFGFVYQHHHLLREFTALENVLMPTLIAGKTGTKQRFRAIKLLTQVGLENRLEHLPNQLSGGEKQRVAIARALMNKPAVLMADEPTGNLDPATAEKVSKLFFDLIKQEKMSLLLVTHNQKLAKQCSKILELKSGKLHKK